MRLIPYHLRLVTALAATPFAFAQQGQEAKPKGGEIYLPGVQRLTVSGQWRFRGEGFYDYDFNKDAGPSADFLSQRARIKLDFQATDDLSFVAELQDVRNWGEETNTLDDSANGMDFHQAYVKVENMPGLGGTMKAGRQRISYGDERLVGSFDWLQQARAFDGVRNRWNCTEGDWTDVFITQVREVFANATTTANYADQYFAGIYGHYGAGENATIEPYLLYLQDDGNGAGATQHVGTLGALAKLNVSEELLVGGEFATQFGETGGVDVPFFEAMAANVHARLNPNGSQFSFGADFDYATGDDPNTADNERFNNLFASQHRHWGNMDMASWSNMMHASLMVAMAFTEQSSLEATLHTFRTLEETDSLSGTRGSLTTGAAAGSSNSMGEELDLVYKLAIATGGNSTAHLHIGYSVFLPGSGVEDAVGTDDIAHFAYVETGVSF